MRYVVFLACLLAACSSTSRAPQSPDDTPQDEPGDEPETSPDAAISRRDATTPRSDPESGASAGDVRLPPDNGRLDYQLGGAYDPDDTVTIVSRDREAEPAPGRYSICYVNGFQTQAEDRGLWMQQHPELLLRDAGGKPVIDPDWNEMLLDVSSDEKRAELAEIVGGWIRGCARAGFDAVEIDNLDSYTRSGRRLREDDAVAFMRMLSDIAHESGLAIAQKNASELVPRRSELGTDFVVAEECNHYRECDDYIAGYGDYVLVIEYRRADFDTGCKRYPNLPIVLRDLDLVRAGQAGYVYAGC